MTGSKDNSYKIVEEFRKKYPEKIIYLEKENGGLSDARNYAIPYCKGEYIGFVDSDDYVEKDMYEKMYEIAKKEKSDMVESDFYWEYPKKTKKDTGEIYENKKEMLQKVRVVAWNKLIKREILRKTKILFPKGYHYEDVEFTYKLIPFLEKVSFLKEPMVHYIQREGSISNSQDERIREIFIVLDNVIKFYKEQGLYEEYKNQLEYVYARYAFCSSFLRITKLKNKKLRKKLIKETWEKVNKEFPNWKENEILKNDTTKKGIYLKTINLKTLQIYSKVLSLL